MGRGESMKDAEIIDEIRQVIRLEAESLLALEGTVHYEYVRAVRLIAESKGKVITTGMGKSGLVAKKIAATLSSTGTLAVFLHPTEALHGDLGILSRKMQTGGDCRIFEVRQRSGAPRTIDFLE